MQGSQDDLILIDKIIEGEESLFRDLVEKHKKYVYTIALKILRNEEDAEEAAQDAFVKAFGALKKFNREAKFTTWLYRIVFNTAITYQRKRKEGVENIDNTRLKETLMDHSKDELEFADKKFYVNKAINSLNPTDATIITLFYLKELSLYEISDVTSLKVNAIKVKLFRSRKRLADELHKLLNVETDSIVG